MKINLTEYIKKAGEKTSLTLSERGKIEGVLAEYMKMKPVRGGEVVRPTQSHGIPFLTLFVSKKYMPIAFIAALILSISGGVSYAAEDSAPGDLLYPVKVSVNEKVESSLALSSEAKAAVEAKLAARRLKEAGDLAANNKFDARAKAELSANFAEHADAAVKETKDVKSKDASAAIDLASNFETDLAAHEALLTEVDAKGNMKGDANLVSLVRAKALLVSKIRMEAEGDADVSAKSAASAGVSASTTAKVRGKADLNRQKEASIQMGRTAKAALKVAQDISARVSSKLEASVSANVSAQISAAGALITRGDSLSANGDFTAAFHAYQDALVTLKRLSVYLNVSDVSKIRILPIARVAPSSQAEDSDMKDSQDDAAPKSIQIFPIRADGDASADVNSNTNTNGSSVEGDGSAGVKIGM
jgi:hypothetical protein